MNTQKKKLINGEFIGESVCVSIGFEKRRHRRFNPPSTLSGGIRIRCRLTPYIHFHVTHVVVSNKYMSCFKHFIPERKMVYTTFTYDDKNQGQ